MAHFLCERDSIHSIATPDLEYRYYTPQTTEKRHLAYLGLMNGLDEHDIVMTGSSGTPGDSTDGSTASMAAAPAPSLTSTQLESNKKVKHLVALIAGTLWWYLLATVSALINPVDLFGWPRGVVDACAVYLTISQLTVYVLVWNLMNARTLRRGQVLIFGCISCCVPADIVLVVLNPIGSKIGTVYAFSIVTVFYGLCLAHYLRLTAIREDEDNEKQLRDATEDAVDIEIPKEELRLKGPIGELIHYRPPMNLQSFHMAIAFTRSFVSFTLAVVGLREAFTDDRTTTVLFLLACSLVASHNAVEVTLTNIFPGVALRKYTSFLIFDAVFYFLDMISSLVIARADGFGDTVWDDVLNSYLFGNATAEFFDRLRLLFANYDFDAKLGLKKQAAD